MIGGEAGRDLGTLGNGAVAGDQDIDVPGGLTQPVECRLVGAHLIGAARVEERDQDVGEHVAGEQDATVREEDRGVADGVRLMLDDLARHGSAVRGQRGDEPDQLEGDARRAPPASLCARSRASLAAWAPAGWRSAAHRRAGDARASGPSGDGWRTRRPPECRAGPGHTEPSMPGSTRINPPSPRTAMALLQTHALCRTQTPSATSFSI